MCSWYASPWSVRPPLRTSELRSVRWLTACPPTLSPPCRVWPQGGTSMAPPGLSFCPPTPLRPQGYNTLLLKCLCGTKNCCKWGLNGFKHSAKEVWQLAVVWSAEHHEMLSDEITLFFLKVQPPSVESVYIWSYHVMWLEVCFAWGCFVSSSNSFKNDFFPNLQSVNVMF